MDFRMRNLKENKQNYNSMAEFTRNNTEFHPISNTADFSTPKIKQLEIRLNNLSEALRADGENNGLLIARLEQRIDQLQRRAPSFGGDMTRIYTKGDVRERSTVGGGQEIAFFKQGITTELAAVRDEMRGQLARSEQVEARQGRLEQELREWIGHQKQEISMKLLNQAEELRGSDIGRQRKYDNQLESLKASLTALQDDVNGKMRAVAGLKQQMGAGLQAVRQEARGDKQAVGRLVKQVKQSFQALRDAIAKDREYVKEAIFELQSTSQDGFNKSNRSIEGLTQSFSERQQKLDKRLSGLRDQWGAFKLNANQKIEDCKSLIVNIESSTLEQLDALKNREGDAGMEALKEQLQQWKRLTEQKNLNVFREISNAMKVLRMEWRKEHDELSKQQEDAGKAMKQLRHSLIDKLDKELTALTQLTHEQFDAFTGQLQQANDLIALSNKELKELITKQVTSLTDTIQIKALEMQTKNQALEEMVNKNIVDTVNGLKGEIQQVQKAANAQIQNLVASITEDNEQWEQDINTTVSKLKQDYAKQIQLVSQNQDKKFSQINQKHQTSLETIKKTIETGLASERIETVKQIAKTTQEITGLINEWIAKHKKEREAGENNLKDALNLQRKTIEQDIADAKLQMEDLKSKAIQKANEDLKKTADLKAFVQQAITKIAKTAEEDQAKNNKKIDTLKTELEGKVKAVSQKILLDINTRKQFQLKAKEEETKAKSAQIEKRIGDASAKIKSEMMSELSKAIKNVEQQSSKTNKKIDAASVSFKKDIQSEVEKDKKYCLDEIAKAKGQIEIKMKAKDEKYMNEINSKRETDNKSKDDELKAKLAEIDKKINDSSTKTKSEILGEVSKAKTAQLEELNKIKIDIDAKIKAFQELKSKKQADSKAKEAELKQKENQIKNKSVEQDKKIETLKKDMQAELDKNKKYCTDEISKAKTEIESKNNSKKEAQAKQREDQLKVKIAQLDKRLNDASSKTKAQILAEINKLKAELDSKMKAFEESKNKKQADSKVKQSQLKEKEAQLKARSAELDKKIDAAKKDLTKTTGDEIAKVKGELEAKIQASTQQFDLKVKTVGDNSTRGSAEDKAKIVELTGKVETMRADIDKRLTELKGVTLVNLKAQEQEANKLQDQKIESLKAYFSEAMETSISATAAALKGSDQRISKMTSQMEVVRLQMTSTKQWLNKVEANVASDREKNNAVYEKMSSDILDMADSITVLISQLKPHQK